MSGTRRTATASLWPKLPGAEVAVRNSGQFTPIACHPLVIILLVAVAISRGSGRRTDHHRYSPAQCAELLHGVSGFTCGGGDCGTCPVTCEMCVAHRPKIRLRTDFSTGTVTIPSQPRLRQAKARQTLWHSRISRREQRPAGHEGGSRTSKRQLAHSRLARLYLA